MIYGNDKEEMILNCSVADPGRVDSDPNKKPNPDPTLEKIIQ